MARLWPWDHHWKETSRKWGNSPYRNSAKGTSGDTRGVCTSSNPQFPVRAVETVVYKEEYQALFRTTREKAMQTSPSLQGDNNFPIVYVVMLIAKPLCMPMAGTITRSMKETIEASEYRRQKQIAYNTEHNKTPQVIKKS